MNGIFIDPPLRPSKEGIYGIHFIEFTRNNQFIDVLYLGSDSACS